MQQLKPCPNIKCGYEDLRIRSVISAVYMDGSSYREGDAMKITCDKCRFSSPIFTDSKELIAYWNDRPQVIHVQYLIWNHFEAIRDSLENSDPKMSREIDGLIEELRNGDYPTKYGGYNVATQKR